MLKHLMTSISISTLVPLSNCSGSLPKSALAYLSNALARLRGKNLVKAKPMGKAMLHDATQLGRMIAC
jgi:hypothetical protein